MNKTKLPCIECGCDEDSPHCTDCEIKQRGLTEVFRRFSRKYLMNSKSDIDQEIAERALESIFKRLDKFRGREGYMEGAFYNFCVQEYENRRNDVLRRNQSRFENEKIQLETEAPENYDSEFSLIDLNAAFDPDRKWNNRLFALKESSILEDIFGILEHIELQGESCAGLIIRWYDNLKKGLSQIEMAKLEDVSYENFRQKLSRCFKKLRPEILTQLTL